MAWNWWTPGIVQRRHANVLHGHTWPVAFGRTKRQGQVIDQVFRLPLNLVQDAQLAVHGNIGGAVEVHIDRERLVLPPRAAERRIDRPSSRCARRNAAASRRWECAARRRRPPRHPDLPTVWLPSQISSRRCIASGDMRRQRQLNGRRRIGPRSAARGCRGVSRRSSLSGIASTSARSLKLMIPSRSSGRLSLSCFITERR